MNVRRRWWCSLAFTVSMMATATPPAFADDAVGSEPWKLRPAMTGQTLLALQANAFTSTGKNGSLGVGVGSQTSMYPTFAMFSARGTGAGFLSSSGSGLTGLYAGDLGLGVRIPVGASHGPVLRVGARGYMYGNDDVWLSSFEAPVLQLGYQVTSGPFLFEAAGRSGYVITGRQTHYAEFNGLEVLERRKLGTSFEVGGHLAVGYAIFRAEAELQRTSITDGLDSPAVAMNGNVCVRPGSWGVCADYRRWTADVWRLAGGTSELDVSYAGLSIGIWSP